MVLGSRWNIQILESVVRVTSRSLSTANTPWASRATTEHHKRNSIPVSYVAGAKSILWHVAIGNEFSSLYWSDDHRKGLLSAAVGKKECMTCISYTSWIECRHILVYPSSVAGSSHGVDLVIKETLMENEKVSIGGCLTVFRPAH
ncbi:hypothetical protein LIER_42404 [Lithospermum erythrorhizon]|uniref:Uncharacterized protein n=1 Tax=Lithospermum erythrorhizon TaxID=34254 RepID=A0AAV3RSD8_LITER